MMCSIDYYDLLRYLEELVVRFSLRESDSTACCCCCCFGSDCCCCCSIAAAELGTAAEPPPPPPKTIPPTAIPVETAEEEECLKKHASGSVKDDSLSFLLLSTRFESC